MGTKGKQSLNYIPTVEYVSPEVIPTIKLIFYKSDSPYKAVEKDI